MTDQELLRLLQEHPEKGLEELMNEYMGLAYTIAAGKLQSAAVREDIEECVSDVFYEIYKNRDKIDLEKGSIKSYFSAIASRKAIDKFRRVSGQPEQISSIDDIDLGHMPSTEEAVENILISQEARKELIRQILDLGTPDSEIFVRKYFLGQSTKEIAEGIQIKENTIDKKVSRGLVKLRKVLAVSMAAVAVAAVALFAVGPENALAAVQRMFNFIPGYGILQDSGETDMNRIEYILAEPVTAENEQASLRLNNAVATKDTITVMLEVVRKGVSEDQIKKEIEEEWELLKTTDKLEKPHIRLCTENQEYDQVNGYWGSGAYATHYTLSYQVDKPDEINTNAVYKLEHVPFDLSVTFRLKDHESFTSLEEIGPTDCHNDISITAVAEKKDGKLNVELYAINNNDYQTNPKDYNIYSFTKEMEKGYRGDDLHLDTSAGRKEYTKPGSFEGPNTKFSFAIDPKDKDLALNIPYILVQSREEQDVKLPVPKPGESITVNQKVAFEGCSMIITEVENVDIKNGGWSEDNCLKMTFRYENEDKGKILARTNFIRISRFGKWLGGGYSTESDEDGVITTCWFALEKGDKDVLRLRISNPIYYLTDSYRLKLN